MLHIANSTSCSRWMIFITGKMSLEEVSKASKSFINWCGSCVWASSVKAPRGSWRTVARAGEFRCSLRGVVCLFTPSSSLLSPPAPVGLFYEEIGREEQGWLHYLLLWHSHRRTNRFKRFFFRLLSHFTTNALNNWRGKACKGSELRWNSHLTFCNLLQKNTFCFFFCF